MPVFTGAGGSLVPLSRNRDLQPFPKSSVPFHEWNDGVGLLSDGRTVSYDQLWRNQVWVAINCNKLTRQISRLPLKPFRRTTGGRQRVRTGRIADLLERPMLGGGPTHFKQALALPTTVHGNALLRKVRVGGPGTPPVRFEPLLWRLLRAHRQEGGPVEMWETRQPGQPRYIDPEDVIHLGWRGLDGAVGVSPLEHLGVTLAIEDAAQRHQVAQFRNGARPPSAISASPEFLGLDREERAELMAQLRGDIDFLYAGPDNAGRPALLPPGLSWEPIGHTSVEVALIEQRKLTREEVAAAYDMPPPLIGMLERSTFNNITELHRMLYVTVLGPWLNLIEETLQAQLLGPEAALRGDVYVEFDLSEVLKGDLLQRAQALALQIGHGVLTIDEAREIENREAFGLRETKLPLYPSNNLTPVGMAPAEPDERQVQQAAQAVAGMDGASLTRLLALSGGSLVHAVLGMTADAAAPELAAAGM